MRVPILQHHTFVYGKALHDAISNYHLLKMKGHDVTLDQLLSFFEHAWISEGFLTRHHEEARLQSGKDALVKFYNYEQDHNLAPTFIEEKFSFTMEDNRIIGRWDRVDVGNSSVSIIDYKSSDVKKQKDADKKVKESLQLAIYTLACRERFPDKQIVCQLHFLESGLIGQTIFPDNKLAQTKTKIEKAASGIRSHYCTATPGYMSCIYCAYNQICPSTAYGSKSEES